MYSTLVYTCSVFSVETPCPIASSQEVRRFVIGAAVIVIDYFTDGVIVNPNHSIGIIFTFLQGTDQRKLLLQYPLAQHIHHILIRLLQLAGDTLHHIAHKVKVIDRHFYTIVENVVHSNSRHDEDSFMFTLKSYDGRPFIIVENVNIDRASMVFKARADMYEEALRAVFDYVQSDNKNKRSYVRGGDVDFKNTGVTKCKSIDHDDFDKWKRRMLQYFK